METYATNLQDTAIALGVQIIVWLFLVLAVPRLAESSPNGSQSPVPAATKHKLAKVQIPFIANQGQVDDRFAFAFDLSHLPADEFLFKGHQAELFQGQRQIEVAEQYSQL